MKTAVITTVLSIKIYVITVNYNYVNNIVTIIYICTIVEQIHHATRLKYYVTLCVCVCVARQSSVEGSSGETPQKN